MSITEKGITPYPQQDIPPQLYRWLQKLVLLFPRVNTYEATINPSSIGATDELDETYTVTGLDLNDCIAVTPPALDAGVGIMSARVSAADTLQIRWRNFTGAPINPAPGTYKILAVRL